MREYFYLNPLLMKAQCDEMFFKMQMDSMRIESLYYGIEKYRNSLDSGKAIEGLKAQMEFYEYALQLHLEANKLDISDYQKLKSIVGMETLNSENIYWTIDRIKHEIHRVENQIRSIELTRNICRYYGFTWLENLCNMLIGIYNLENSLNLNLKTLFEKKIETYYRMKHCTSGLFQQGQSYRSMIGCALKQSRKDFISEDGGKTWKYKSSIQWYDLLSKDMAKAQIQRPEGLSDKQWNAYKKFVCKKIDDMYEAGWRGQSLCAFADEINNANSMETKSERLYINIGRIRQKASIVGSDVFVRMWDAWPTVSEKGAKQKISFFMEYIGMGIITVDKETGKYKVGEQSVDDMLKRFDKNLDPNNKFWSNYAEVVRKAYPDGFPTLKMDDEEFFDIQNIHQFRYIIDAQQVSYIRNCFPASNDAESLALYLSNIDDDDWTHKESARLHQKTKNDDKKTYPSGMKGPNYKIVCNECFHSEFIIDANDNFLFILDENEETKENSIVNGASFNYAEENDYGKKKSMHKLYDASLKQYDPVFRIELIKNENYIASKSDIYKDSEAKKESIRRAQQFEELVQSKRK